MVSSSTALTVAQVCPRIEMKLIVVRLRSSFYRCYCRCRGIMVCSKKLDLSRLPAEGVQDQ
jgi:hypothetical protein